MIFLVCDNYLIVTTDTRVMTSSTPGATPNIPPGIYEVLISSTVTRYHGTVHHQKIACSSGLALM